MEITTTSISCGVSQLYDLTAADLGDAFHAAIRRKAAITARSNKENNEWLRSRGPQTTYPPDTVAGILKDPEWYNRLFPAHYIFSDADSYKNGKRLQAFIEGNGLGKVVSCESRLNVNSGNTITTWIWVVDKAACVKWLIDNAVGVNYIPGLVERDNENAELRTLLAALEVQLKDKENGCTCPSCRPLFDTAIRETQDRITKLTSNKVKSAERPVVAEAIPVPQQAVGTEFVTLAVNG